MRGLWLVAAFLWLAMPARADEAAIARGEYMVWAAGCTSCHTDRKNGGASFAGGLALKTPFGTYYSPNITPDPETGIGDWTDADFLAALKHGRSPEGSHYFPVFPYTTYTRMHDRDALDIKAYLFSLPPVSHTNRPHDVSPPFSWRWTMAVWKWLFFTPGEWQDDPERDAEWNRGGYLVEAAAHCGECHTPRNAMGALDAGKSMAGTVDGPDGELVPNITPHPETGIGSWSQGDIASLLRDGMKPDFDNVQGSMGEAIRDGLGKLTEDDLNAIAAYIKALPAIDNKVERQN